jgi:16S rRNA (cytosine967-C5)-methyltransferase
MTNPASPRQLAWELMRLVHDDGAFANLAWENLLGSSELSREEKAFATHLAYGTLRLTGTLDRILESAAGRDQATIEPAVWWVLRLGTFQWLWMRTPAHAVVNESVKLAKKCGRHAASGLVNAVLRTVTANDLAAWSAIITDGVESPAELLGLKTAHPVWIVDALGEAWGECDDNDDDLIDVLAANNPPAHPTLALLPGLASPLATDTRTPYSPVGVVHEQGSPSQDPRVRQGHARVQDEGSQLAALLLTDSSPLLAGETLLDMCSGPGGKSALIQARAAEAGASLTAIEKAPHRALLVDQALAPFADTALPPRVLVGDASAPESVVEGVWDRVILDAPCTGLGALRRRPESRWRKNASDIDTLVALQRSLLRGAFLATRPGGLIVYVTCSPVVAETTQNMAWFAADYPVTLLDTADLMESVTRVPLTGHRRGSAVQLWPHRHNTDAMFIQAIRRDG